jgi:RNA polymerase sigma-70 factor, ECF subfamily
MFPATIAPRFFGFAPTRRGRRFRLARMNSPAENTGHPDLARLHAGLMAAVARGDRPALGRLYDQLARPLYSLAFRVTSDAAEAQDIVQDVFLQLWHKAGDYNLARGSVFSWAATLTRNRAIDRVRTRKRRNEIIHESATDLPGAEAAGEGDSAEALALHEQATAVRSALAGLAPEQKSAIELAFFSGLTQQEIAEKLQEPLGTIKARIRRGLLRLRETIPNRL